MSVLLNTVKSFSSKSLRQHTLSTLLALSGINSLSLTLPISTPLDRDKTMDNVEIMKHLNKLVTTLGAGPEGFGHVFASFLPGMSVALTNLVTSNSNLGSSVTVLSLLTWVHYVSIVMKDSEYNSGKSEERKFSKESKLSKDDPGGKKLVVERSLAWQEGTDAKLCVLVQRISGLVTSSSWRVRMGLVVWAHILLSHTHRYSKNNRCTLVMYQCMYTYTVNT